VAVRDRRPVDRVADPQHVLGGRRHRTPLLHDRDRRIAVEDDRQPGPPCRQRDRDLRPAGLDVQSQAVAGLEQQVEPEQVCALGGPLGERGGALLVTACRAEHGDRRPVAELVARAREGRGEVGRCRPRRTGRGELQGDATFVGGRAMLPSAGVTTPA